MNGSEPLFIINYLFHLLNSIQLYAEYLSYLGCKICSVILCLYFVFCCCCERPYLSYCITCEQSLRTPMLILNRTNRISARNKIIISRPRSAADLIKNKITRRTQGNRFGNATVSPVCGRYFRIQSVLIFFFEGKVPYYGTHNTRTRRVAKKYNNDHVSELLRFVEHRIKFHHIIMIIWYLLSRVIRSVYNTISYENE